MTMKRLEGIASVTSIVIVFYIIRRRRKRRRGKNTNNVEINKVVNKSYVQEAQNGEDDNRVRMREGFKMGGVMGCVIAAHAA